MMDCDDLVETLQAQARDQVQLALLADATPVAAMHLDLALFSGNQARVADELCKDELVDDVESADAWKRW